MKQINKILCLLLCLAISLSAMAQQLNISGTVIDENNEPVPGAGVVVKGTTIGVVTDVDGNYSIQAPADATLTFSFVGMGDVEEAVGGRNRIDAQLKTAANELDEVVIVGYGTQKKAHLTGAVATVAPTEITDLSSSDLSSTLVGQVTGVSVTGDANRPGESARIIIRDAGKDVGGTDEEKAPLFVIDGFISTQSAFNNLDPNMIENISILKDAAAAIYGARSALGVVLVTTKSGKVGRPKITYSGQVGVADEFYRSKLMNSYEHGLAWNAYRAADPRQTGFSNLYNLFQLDELEAMKGLNYDLLDKYWSPALTQKHSISVSGGSENATYFGGVSYQTQDGNIGRLDHERWNVNVGVNAKINKWTTAALRVSGDWGETQRPQSQIGGGNSAERDYNMLLLHARYIPEFITGPDGQQLPIAAFGVTNNAASNSAQMYHFSTIENMGDFIQQTPQNLVINSSVDFDFGIVEVLKGLKARATYSKSIGTSKTNRLQSLYNLWKLQDGTIGRGGSGNHLFVDTPEGQLNYDNMSAIEIINGSSSALRREMNRSDNYQLNFTLTYARDFGKHSVSGLFTVERSESENEDLWGQVLQPSVYTNLQSITATGAMTTSFGRSEAGTLSYAGRLNYAYDDKYLAEFQLRSDASTKFAPENYWGYFPSLSLGWIMSRESWFADNLPFVNFFKFRGSFGLLGRDNVPAWAWLMTYNPTQDKGGVFGESLSTLPSANIDTRNTVPNRNSHWDKVYKSNLGFDMNFLKNRLSVTLEGYYDMARETFMTINDAPEFPGTVGASASPSNYGENNTYGIELSLGWKDKVGDIGYFVKLNTSYSDNKLLKFPGQDNPMRKYSATVAGERSDRGVWGLECIGMFRTYQEIAEYFAENNIATYFGSQIDDVHPGTLIYRDIRGSQATDGSYYPLWDGSRNPDGTPNSEDPIVVRAGGNVITDDDQIRMANRSNNIYGFTLNFGGDWKGISVSAQLGASWGSYSFLKPSIPGMTEFEYTNLPSFFAGNYFVYDYVFDARGRVVAAQNTNAKYPSLRFSNNFKESTFWRISSANVLLRNLTVSYTLPKEWVNKVGVESCRLNLTGQNLWELYNPYPDKFMSVNSSYANYPLLRRFTLGLNVTF